MPRLCWLEKVQQAPAVVHARAWFHPSPTRSVEAYHYYRSHECLLSNPSRTWVDEILRRCNSVPWGPGVYPFSDGNSWLRNCLGTTHVSCVWRSYSRRSCCQVRRRSLLRSRLTRRVTAQLKTSAPGPRQVQPQTIRFQNCNQPKFTVILCWILDSTLQTSPHCNRNVKPEAVGRIKSFIDASKPWPALYPSAPPNYQHWTLSSQVASLTRGFNGLMMYSRHYTVLILPFLQAGLSSSSAPMINYGSPPTVLSKLQELVLPWQ